MDVFYFSTIIFVLFFFIKIGLYHGLKNLKERTWFMDQVCVTGYYGFVADPFDCDAYHKCPERVKFYCDPGTQFNPDTATCVPAQGGCVEAKERRLLL
jgi:Chitin binding Peritrophin-A domain